MSDIPLHPNHRAQSDAEFIRPALAITYAPVILMELSDDGKTMFAEVLQSCIDGAYEQGFRDAVEQARKEKHGK